MFNQFEPNVKATIAFLKLLNVKVNATTVDKTLQNHPDWPSLLCISDSLNKWNVLNAAGKVEPDKIDELPTPFIAYTGKRENPLSVVTKITGSTIELLAKNYNTPIVLNKADFIKSWPGVYLIAEPTTLSGEKDFKLNKRKALINSLVPASLFILIFAISFFCVYQNVSTNLVVTAAAIYGQYFILLGGVIITSLLLWYEIDKNNPLLQKVCTGITKGDCNAILTGKQAKVFSWLSWSEVGFFYFSGSLLTLVIPSLSVIPTQEGSISLLAWLNIFALPYTIFSIYYQWRIAKQWCVLCLAVQALLVLGGINVFANDLLAFPFSFSITTLAQTILVFLIPVLIWYVIKPFVLKLQESKNTKREYLRIKFNAEIFETLLKKQKAITLPTDGLGIILGNPAATNTLIKVCNPYCGPCAKAHSKIEKLLENIPNLKAQILFTTPNNPANAAYKPVSHLLAIAAENNEEKIKHALDDWYLPEKKDYEIFAKKYPITANGKSLIPASQISSTFLPPSEGIGEAVEAMDKWCNIMEIKATPTILINGYQLPDAYSIEDLQYFLLE